jgi:hypothetical protein
METTMQTKMYFFHGKTKDGKRFTICGTENGGTIIISGALCSYRDSFSRKIGRYISQGRLEKMKNTVLKPVETGEYVKILIEFGVKLNKHNSDYFKKTFEL